MLKHRKYKQPEKLTRKKQRDLGHEKAVERAQPRFIPANILAHAAQRWKNWSTAEKIAYTAIIILAVSSSVTMAYYCFTYGYSAFYEMLDSYFTATHQKAVPVSTPQTEVGFFKSGGNLSSANPSRALSDYIENISISWEPSAEKTLAKTKAESFKEFVLVIKELLPQTMQPKLLQKIFENPSISTPVKSTSAVQTIKIKIATSAYLDQDRARFEFASKTLYVRYEERPDKGTLLRSLRNELNHALNQKTNEDIFKRNSLPIPPDSRQGNPFFNEKGLHDSKLLMDFSQAIAAGDARINNFKKLFEKQQARVKMTSKEDTSLNKHLNVIAAYQPLNHYKTITKMQLRQALEIGSFKKSKEPGIKYIASKERNPQLPYDFYITEVLTTPEGAIELKGTFAKDDSSQEKTKAFLADYAETRKIYNTRERAYYANDPDALIAQRLSDIEEWEPDVREHFYGQGDDQNDAKSTTSVCELLTKRHFEHPEQEDYCAPFEPRV
jgi:hypothetical protein